MYKVSTNKVIGMLFYFKVLIDINYFISAKNLSKPNINNLVVSPIVSFLVINLKNCTHDVSPGVQDVLPQSNRRKTPALQQSKILKSKIQLHRGCPSSELRNFVYAHYQPHV